MRPRRPDARRPARRRHASAPARRAGRRSCGPPRPDLEVVDIRGNVDTRLGRVPNAGQDRCGRGRWQSRDLDAVVLAAAGLEPAGRRSPSSSNRRWPTAPGQGALAIEVPRGATPEGHALDRALAALDHAATRLAVTAERACWPGSRPAARPRSARTRWSTTAAAAPLDGAVYAVGRHPRAAAPRGAPADRAGAPDAAATRRPRGRRTARRGRRRPAELAEQAMSSVSRRRTSRSPAGACSFRAAAHGATTSPPNLRTHGAIPVMPR